MPQNMQKKSKVASLDVETDDDVIEAELMGDVNTMSEDDIRYRVALKHLQHGKDVKGITSQLVKDGMTRTQAVRLAQRVYDENPQEQRTNAKILFGGAAFFAALGVIFIGFQLYNTGGLSIFAPSYVFLLMAAWFAYKGYQEWRKLG